MANETYQIDNPTGGPPITIPAWASEETMRTIAMDAKTMANIDSALVKVSKNFSKDLQDAFFNISQQTRNNNSTTQQNTEQTKNTTKETKKFARKVVESTSFLGDTQRPLTSLVGAMKNAGPAIGGAIAQIFKPLGKKFAEVENGGLTALASKIGENGEVITDAAFMWLGWNVGKLEAFSEVQKQMIDNGAIMFGTHEAFNQLRVNVNQSGVTYDAFSKTIAANGSAINAFGGNVSLGTRRFADFFGNLEQTADALGDFGISNAELLQQTGEFLEFQRMTGGLARDSVGLEKDLTDSFTQLQLETAGLASITGLQRSQLLQNRLQVNNVDFAAGMANLKGDEREAANEARVMFADIESIAGVGSPISTLANATARALAVVNGNLGALNIEQVAQAMNAEDVAALKKAFGEDVIDKLQLAIQSGDQEAVKRLFLDMRDADLTRLGNQVATTTDALASASNSLAQAMLQFKQAYGNFSYEEYRKAREDAVAGLAEAGSSTVMLNDATKAFLAIQETFTLSMASLTTVFGSASSAVNDVIQYFNNNAQDQFKNELPDVPEAARPTEQDSAYDISHYRQQARTGPLSMRAENQKRLDEMLDQLKADQAEWDSKYGDRYDPTTLEPLAFGGPMQAGRAYLVGEVGPEVVVSPEDKHVLTNRELNDMMNTQLTGSSNSSIMEVNIAEEYRQAIAAKKKSVEILTNVKNMNKAKSMNDRLRAQIDASGA